MEKIVFSGDYGTTKILFFDNTIIREIRSWTGKIGITIFIPINGTLEIFKEYTK